MGDDEALKDEKLLALRKRVGELFEALVKLHRRCADAMRADAVAEDLYVMSLSARLEHLDSVSLTECEAIIAQHTARATALSAQRAAESERAAFFAVVRGIQIDAEHRIAW